MRPATAATERADRHGRRGLLAPGLEGLLLVALVTIAGAGAWRLNRTLPAAAAVVTASIPADALVLDARGQLAYRRAHLPGAQQLWSRELLSFAGAVPGTLAEPSTIAEKLRGLGLSAGQQVVVYDEGDGEDAPLVVLVLHAFGVDARLLVGGLGDWVERGGPVSEGGPRARAPSNTEFVFDRRLLVGAEETLEHLADNLIAPFDVRDGDRYVREHVAEAVHLGADTLLPAGRLPRWSVLHEHLHRARLTIDTHPLIYGADLQQAARAWLALRAYGLPHMHVYAGPFEGLVNAGVPVSQTASDRAVSVPSSSVCWR